MAEEEEFAAIVGDILKPNLTLEELKAIIARWADNRLRILRRHGVYEEVDKGKMEGELLEKALGLRERLGLPDVRQSRD